MFKTGTELRLYEADPTGVTISSPDPRDSVAWWAGPLVLRSEAQMARIEFDGERLEIGGKASAGEEMKLIRGRTYLLALTIAGADPRSVYAEIQQVVPLLRVAITEQGLLYVVYSGIIEVKQQDLGVTVRQPGRVGWMGRELDLTPRDRTPVRGATS